MQSKEEDLVRMLSARLSGEIENLPKDGKDHAFTVNIKGNRGHINLGHQTFDIKTAKQPPPEGSNRSRDCPQCGNRTWRYTRLCVHCDYNLHHHDTVAADEKERARKEKSTLQMLRFSTACVAAALLIFFIKDYLPDFCRPWALAVTAVFGLLAFVIMTTPSEYAAKRLPNSYRDVVMDESI